MKKVYKRPEEILKEPYSRTLIPDKGSGTYSAIILEFPGCIAEGDTPQEAYEHLEDAAKSWIEAAIDLKQEIPSPSQTLSYGGRVLLRLPKGLHRQAAVIADRENVSLNQFIVSTIAEKVGAFTLMEQFNRKIDEHIIKITSNVANTIMTIFTTANTPPTIGINPWTPDLINTEEVKTYAGNEDYNIFTQRSSDSTN